MDPGKNEVNNENIKTEENVKTKQDLGGKKTYIRLLLRALFPQNKEMKLNKIILKT